MLRKGFFKNLGEGQSDIICDGTLIISRDVFLGEITPSIRLS